MEDNPMKNAKRPSQPIINLAATTLTDNNASKTAKSLAGSVISQAGTDKQTGSKLEDLASKVLTSEKYSDDTKSLAGSVLSQSNKKR
jgi:hypothetical protein